MRILFLHPNFPAQFRMLAAKLAEERSHQVVFGTMCEQGSLPGVHKALFRLGREPHKTTHQYLRTMESAVLQGQAAARMALGLRKKGFIPDVIYGHSGWGSPLFMRDIFPDARLLGYFEWYYHAHGSDADFDPADPLTLDSEVRLRLKNAPILLDLVACDGGPCPTRWQLSQFPAEFHGKLDVRHDGIDTDFFCPHRGTRLKLPRLSLDLSEVEQLITYVARGLEPYRGFPQFIEGLPAILAAHPGAHVVIVGEDRVAYGKPLPQGESWKTKMLAQVPLDLARVHFTGRLSYAEYLQVLQASSVHVYLTRPFVLSWSVLEAMSAGCLVIASDTAPVREIIEDSVNGLLTDFFDVAQLADRVVQALAKNDDAPVRAAARATICQRFALRDLLPKHVAWLRGELI